MDANLLLHFHKEKTIHFQKRISVDPSGLSSNLEVFIHVKMMGNMSFFVDCFFLGKTKTSSLT